MGLSPEEMQYQRTQLLNKQQLELSNLDRKLSEEEREIEKGALTDWEVRYARAKLGVKEKHYKVGDALHTNVTGSSRIQAVSVDFDMLAGQFLGYVTGW